MRRAGTVNEEYTMSKKTYRAPNLKVHGSLEALTQGASTGTQLDSTFPTGTPFGQLTFS